MEWVNHAFVIIVGMYSDEYLYNHLCYSSYDLSVWNSPCQEENEDISISKSNISESIVLLSNHTTNKYFKSQDLQISK